MSNLEGRRYPRRLTINGGSLTICIPTDLVKQLGWHAGNYLSVSLEGEKVIVEWTHLNRPSEATSRHNPVPAGRHGRKYQRENEEAAVTAGASNHGTSKPG